MRERKTIGLGLAEYRDGGASNRVPGPPAPVERGGNWLGSRLVAGTVIGALAGYVGAMIFGKQESAKSIAFWTAFVGFLVGFVVTVDVRDGRLIFDGEAFSKTWGREGWESGRESLAGNSVLILVTAAAFVVISLGLAWVDRNPSGLWITLLGAILGVVALWSRKQPTDHPGLGSWGSFRDRSSHDPGRHARFRQRLMLAGGVLLFVYNIVPDTPLNHMSEVDRRMLEIRIAMGRASAADAGGYYWSNGNVLLAAAGAALALFALAESQNHR